jgi:hypothetical protein
MSGDPSAMNLFTRFCVNISQEMRCTDCDRCFPESADATPPEVPSTPRRFAAAILPHAVGRANRAQC